MRREWAWPAVSSAVLLALTLPVWLKPYGSDEVWFLLAGRNAWETGRPVHWWPEAYYHPPLYHYLVGLVQGLWPHWSSARLVGLATGLGTLAVAARAAAALGLPAWTPLLLALNPAFVQGSRLLDIDNTLLTPLLTAVLALALEAEAGKPRVALRLGAAWLASLLSKITTQYLVLLLLAWRWVKHWDCPARRSALAVAAASAAAALLLAAWCRVSGLPADQLFAHASGRFQTQMRGGLDPRALAQHAAETALWLTPGLLGLFCLGALRAWKARPEDDRLWLFAAYAAPVLAGYTVLGSWFGFPKYLVAAVPAACLTAACVPLPSPRRTFVAAAGLAAAVLFASGDPYLALRWGLRQAVGSPRAGAALLSFAGLFALWNLVPLAAWFVFLRRGGPAALFWVAAASQAVAADVRQVLAPYNTVNHYGEIGVMEAVSVLREHCGPGRRAVASMHLLGYLSWHGVDTEYVGSGYWHDPLALPGRLAAPEVCAFAWGRAAHQPADIRKLESPEMARLLAEKSFRRARAQDPQVWVRGAL